MVLMIPKNAQGNKYQMNDPSCQNGAAYIGSECNNCYDLAYLLLKINKNVVM